MGVEPYGPPFARRADTEDVIMKARAVILASCALVALPAAAGAGQCTSEIESLTKVLVARDAGSGPTPGAASSGMGQHPPTTAMGQADQGGAASAAAEQSGKPQHPPTAIMNRETTGSSTPSEFQQPQQEHPPTAVMNRETDNSAASAQDVQRQTQGQPTASRQAQGQGQIPEAHKMAEAMNQIERARLLDQQGKENDCLSAIGMAKLMSGAR
jgi:hypothetical protein